MIGLSSTWDNGTIYCSTITRRLLLNKYPSLEGFVIGLAIEAQHWIPLNPERTKGVTIYMFEANHILGAVMILFQGVMGNILYTGDFRYTSLMLNNHILFPENRRNKKLRQIAIDIDHLIIDNTFCDPIFKHPSKHEAVRMLIDIIESHKDHKVIIFLYKTGKEELLIELSKVFKTLVLLTFIP